MPPISIPIIDQLTNPSLGLLSRVAFPANPYNTFLAIAPPQNPLVALTYGFVALIHTVPPAWGLTLGEPVIYDPPLAQVAAHYVDLSGFDIVQQIEYIRFTAQPYIWKEPLPGLVTMYISPGVEFDFFWLQT